MPKQDLFRRCEMQHTHLDIYGAFGQLLYCSPRVILTRPAMSKTYPHTVRGMFHSTSLEDVRRFLLHAIRGHVRVTQMHPEDTPQYAVGLDLGGDRGMTWLAIWST